jgi:hypothetical protein
LNHGAERVFDRSLDMERFSQSARGCILPEHRGAA